MEKLRARLQKIRYSLHRDWLDLRYKTLNKPARIQTPGPLKAAEPISSGMNFTFSQAKLEIVFLSPDIVRLTWEPGLLPIPYVVAPRQWPKVDIDYREHPDGWDLKTKNFTVTIGYNGEIQFNDESGKAFRQESPPGRLREAWRHKILLHSEEHIYGLGERAAPFNLRPGSYQMWNKDPGGSYGPGVDPIYMTIPVYYSQSPAGRYLVFYENSFPGTFRFHDAAEILFQGGALRYYVIPGAPDHAISAYSELTGRPPLPPSWALGYHQSRWGYHDEETVREVVESYQRNELPLDAIHLDIDYMDGYRLFTVDEERFPGVENLVKDFAEQGIHTVTILDCGIKRDPNYEVYRRGLQNEAYCVSPNGKPITGLVWPGWSVFPDFTSPKARTWWGENYQALLDLGVAGIWHDMNEPTSFAAWGDTALPLTTRHALEGRGGDHREAHNLYGLLMAKAGFEAMRKFRPDKRPWLLTRSGWAGIQRYSWHWTGDTETSWTSLRQTVAAVLGLGFSGVPFTGPDIGGFSGAPDAELFIRWHQLAAFLPFFRNHSAMGTPRREPWRFGLSILDIAREFLRLRRKLRPYLYTLAWEASQTGHPLVRPLFWHEEMDQRLWALDDTFTLGNAFLVAPVLESDAETRSLTLPEGLWYDFWEKNEYKGPDEIELEVALDRIPVLVRAGSILPLASGSSLELHIFAQEEGISDGILYSDAGDGYGDWRLDRFRTTRLAEELRLDWEQEGEFLFPYEGIVVHLHGFTAQEARIDDDQVQVPLQDNKLEIGFFQRVRFIGNFE